MRDYIFAKQLIYACLSSYEDLDYLGSLMKSIDRENLQSTWKVISNDDTDKWNGFLKVNFPIQKLIFIAKTTNPEKYDEMIAMIACRVVDDCPTNTSYDVSKVFYELYNYKYKYISKNQWYKYDDELNEWVLDENCQSLKKDISNDLRKIFIDRCFFYWNKMSRTTDNTLKNEYDLKGTLASEVFLNLRRPIFINDVITESKCLFIDDSFKNKK
jgi:hypothetical protein